MSRPNKENRRQQAMWGGRFHSEPADLMVRFSESVSFDQRLALFDILGSKAHAAMLYQMGLLTARERAAIEKGLDAILGEIEAGKFKWDTKLEDVHMNIEQALTKRLPAAAKLHTARSRNDQVAVDMCLFFKWACTQIEVSLKKLMACLIDLAEAHQEIALPAYTHSRRAQPVSFAHYLLCYVEMFARDRERFFSVYDHANICPLGAGAVAGSTLPIDRKFVAERLGFVDRKGHARLTQNSMDAVADRDLHLEFVGAIAICGTHFSRVAEDFILWSSAEFRYIDLPEAFTTGSSLMPQKKNPDALELLRGKAARLQGNLQTLLTLVKGLPLTYNRDLQEDKPPVFDSFDQIVMSLTVLESVLAGITVKAKACASAVSDPTLLATDLVDYLVEREVPFREAHHTVGRLVALAEREGVPLNALDYAQVYAVHRSIGQDWQQVFDLNRALDKRDKTGMPGPRQVKRQITRWRKALASTGSRDSSMH